MKIFKTTSSGITYHIEVSQQELNIIRDCIGFYVSDYNSVHDLSKEYDMLKTIKSFIKED